jgi:hypothetical protein
LLIAAASKKASAPGAKKKLPEDIIAQARPLSLTISNIGKLDAEKTLCARKEN